MWLPELILHLAGVFTKLMLKLGLKIILPFWFERQRDMGACALGTGACVLFLVAAVLIFIAEILLFILFRQKPCDIIVVNKFPERMKKHGL